MSPDSNFDSLELHIEELVLHGFPQVSHAEIARHIEMELSNLLRQGHLPASLVQGGALANLNGGTFDVSPNTTPQALGAQVAQTLYRGLGQ